MVIDIGIVKNHIKPKADSTLRNMRKDDLIEYIRTLEHNYNVAVSFNENQAKYIESLGITEVVHGRWEKASEKMPIYRCSICKERNLFKNGYNVLSNYCPNCGAKMDGERKDNERKAD